ncbi:hypothetical protein [Levilactobacillus humaensis]|uniref:hypothetical protein n=1 Tax=Levilactobacillus humaensis TaxID=2950375 RepID=UPI0021C450CD|nr:hypothetical protein [Levilactobacillus humaensis]
MQIFLDEIGNESQGIILASKPDIPTAQRNVVTTMVPGSTHGNLTQFQGWQDVEVKCTFTVVPLLVDGLTGQQGFNDILRRLNAWVLNAKRLKFSDDRPFYRMVKQVSVDAASPGDIELVGTVPVTFTLDPFWYRDADPVTLTGTSNQVFNPGTVDAEPLLSVYGSGTVKFTVNGEVLTLLKVSDFLTVDSWEKTVVHGDDATIYDEQLDGAYPVLPPGNNEIDLGTASKITIEGRWRWL